MLFLLALLATLNGTVDANPIETYTDAAALLNKHGIVYSVALKLIGTMSLIRQSLLNAHYERVTKAF